MKKWALIPLFAVFVLFGASLTFTQTKRSQHGVVNVPYSTQEMPWDVGIRAHTNHLIMVRPDLTGSSPSGETPGSLSCVYQTVSGPSGCPISTSTTVATGGSGIIAIVDAYDYPTAASDFLTFSGKFGLPTGNNCNGGKPCFRAVYASGTQPRANCGWAQEAALDIEWAHAMAPNAQIVLVEAASNSFSNLFAAVDVATGIVTSGGGSGEVSMSWGGSEFSGESSNDSHFATTGVVYFASSGDSGGKVIYPSASPNVISAGGTSVNRSNGINFSGESAWSSGGGGPSANEAEPSYQSVVTTVNLNGARGTPDFSFDSDPTTGVSVYDTTSCQGLSGWLVFGGTSVAAPIVAAVYALTGNASALNHAQSVYTNHASLFDVTSGSNGA